MWRVQAFKDGMDFYYAERNQVRMQDCICGCDPLVTRL